MSSEGPSKKRCIVKTLDFENCVVSNIRTRARGKTKLRARMTREIKRLDKTPTKSERPRANFTAHSPVLSQRTGSGSGSATSSPVLFTKPSKGSDSPLFLNKRKLNFQEESTKDSSTIHQSTPSSWRTSPVFKIKTFKSDCSYVSDSQESKWNEECLRSKIFQRESSDTGRIQTKGVQLQKKTNLESVESAECSVSEASDYTANKPMFISYQIDDFTQESKHNVKMSSESGDVKSSADYSVDMKNDSNKETSGSTQEGGFSEPVIGCPNIYESQKEDFCRRNFKKNSLLSRLQKLLQKQASEKLLWQHQKSKTSISSAKKVSVVQIWNEDTCYIIKCLQDSSKVDCTKRLFLFVDCKWVPCIKNVKKGSILQIYPPWQNLSVNGFSTSVLLGVICLEIITEDKEPLLDVPVAFESLLPHQYDFDHHTFIGNLFSAHTSAFLF